MTGSTQTATGKDVSFRTSDKPQQHPQSSTVGTGFEYAEDLSENRFTGEVSDEPAFKRTQGAPSSLRSGIGNIDADLIRKATEITESLSLDDYFDTQLHLTALQGLACDMWASASESSELHQELLAVFESAVRQTNADGDATHQQLDLFRECLCDLSRPSLVRAHAEVLRSQFIRMGFKPLAFLDEPNEQSDED